MARLASGSYPAIQEAELRGQAGWELVRLARFPEAIEQLEVALTLIASVADPNSVNLHRRISLTLAMAHLLLAEDQTALRITRLAAAYYPLHPRRFTSARNIPESLAIYWNRIWSLTPRTFRPGGC